MVFGVLAQPSIILLLGLTGLPSEYFPFALLLVTATVFLPNVRHTVIVAAATAMSLVVVAILAPSANTAAFIADLGTRILGPCHSPTP